MVQSTFCVCVFGVKSKFHKTSRMRKPLLGTEHRNSTLIIRDGSDADQLLRNEDEDESGGERAAKGGDGKTFLMEDYRPQASWMTLIAFWICGTGLFLWFLSHVNFFSHLHRKKFCN